MLNEPKNETTDLNSTPLLPIDGASEAVGDEPAVKAQKRRRQFLKRAGAAAMGVTAFCAIGTDTDDIRIDNVRLNLRGWPQSAAGYRIGQISDLHYDSEASGALITRAVEMLQNQQPDAVFITGDYTTQDQWLWADGCIARLKPLAKTRGGTYCILGNHDGWPNNPRPNYSSNFVISRMRAAGFGFLVNETVMLKEVPEVAIVGVGSMSHGAADLPTAVAGLSPGAPKILLAHEPDFADSAPPGYMIQISGHSHAGQVRIPGMPPFYCPKGGRKYPEGLQHTPTHPVYTNRGIGLIGIQMRMYCPPEITIFHLYPAA